MLARVLIVDDHPLVRLGLTWSLDQHPRLEKCGDADSQSEALLLAEEEAPDAMIVDLTLRDGDGLDLIRRVRQRGHRVAIVVSSMHDRDVYERRCLQAGADAYVPKEWGAEQLMRAVMEAVDSPKRRNKRSCATLGVDSSETTSRLTDRELEVFRLIGKGRSTREIASALHRSVKTIEAFRSKIKRKLELGTSEQLVRDAVRWVYENDAA